MATKGPADQAKDVIAACRLSDDPTILAIGTFDDRITVLRQQHRALNLAWALIESKQVPTQPDSETSKIAIIGAGFTGLTLAAALLQKQCRCQIAIFEERDTLLPLQQGSDTRWLHPNVYDWPAAGSEAAAAMLPLLNWTAARASDVVVQVLAAWQETAARKLPEGASLEVWCNTRHIETRRANAKRAQVEWVGDRRDPATGRNLSTSGSAEGKSEDFDLVILAVGFGLEMGQSSSYWRNEEFGQPNLGQQRTTYMVSGQGDGAMIDLLRLKVSQFRQDRILSELLNDKNELLAELDKLRSAFLEPGADFSLFDSFEELTRKAGTVRMQMIATSKELGNRLRRDTEVVLQLKPETRSIADLLQAGTCRTSFQNALLIYLLYRCGGFSPVSGERTAVAARFGIHENHVIERHGPNRFDLLQRLLPKTVYQDVEERWKWDRCQQNRQSADVKWRGGYFGTPGRAADFGKLKNKERATWRKEYLPGPTALIAMSIVGAVVGRLTALRPNASHFRVTLHRVIRIHGEDLLQQACGYGGTNPEETTAGRTYPVDVATIGLAYRMRQIVRSVPGVDPKVLDKAMDFLNLNEASRDMAKEVRFVAAIPILQPDDLFREPSPVCAVLYFDSQDESFDLSDDELTDLITLLRISTETIRDVSARPLDRLQNAPLCPISPCAKPAASMPKEVADALVLPPVSPPRLAGEFALNYDHSDLTPIAR